MAVGEQANAHAGAETSDPEVRGVLDQHYRELREAMHAALVTAVGARDPGRQGDARKKNRRNKA